MKIEQLLRLAADMERFSPGEDSLSALVRGQDDALSEEELEFVSAAGAKPGFESLLKRIKQ